jgi:hypothetical protein
LRAFARELAEAVRLSFADGAPHAIEGVLAAWRHTAEIYANPELHRELTKPLDGTDFGPIS